LLSKHLGEQVLEAWKLVLVLLHEVVHLKKTWGHVWLVLEERNRLPLHAKEVSVGAESLVAGAEGKEVLGPRVLQDLDIDGLLVAEQEAAIHEALGLLLELERRQEVHQICELQRLAACHFLTAGVLAGDNFLALNNH